MVRLETIIEKFDLKVIGRAGKKIMMVTDLINQHENGLTWAKADKYTSLIEKGTVLLNKHTNFSVEKNITYVLTDKDPKLIFSQIIQDYFTPASEYYLHDDTSFHRKNNSIKIAANVFIGKNVKIGEGTIIHPFVSIQANSIIGENCVIKSHTSIGTEGLGFVLNEETDEYVKFPQIGNAVLENNVEIGPSSTVRRGALKETRIKSGAKIGSLINIGHNCIIGKNVILTCNIVTSGSSTIGDYSFIGVNSVIRNGVNVGKNTQVGMGSIVTKSIPDNVVAYGNPAKVIRENN